MTYYTHTGLDAGTTYCYTAWGLSGNVTDPIWSTCNTTLLLTTLGVAASDDPLPTSPMPTNWFTESDSTRMSGFILYPILNTVGVGLGMNQDSFWLLFAVMASIVAGLMIFFWTHSIMFSVIAVCLGIIVGWTQGIIPGWIFGMSMVTMIFMIGIRLRSVQ